MVLEHNTAGAALSLPATLKLQKVLCWVNSTEQVDWTVQIGKALEQTIERRVEQTIKKMIQTLES